MLEKLNFIFSGDIISITVGSLLIIMSIISWYLIAFKTYASAKQNNAVKKYVRSFWASPNLAEALKIKDKSDLSLIVKRAVSADDHYRLTSNQKANNIASKDEFIARAINRAIMEKSESLEEGLTTLASIGSIAPFVGLFGTVWGIYHALESISLSGQATLDKVAGPVGEALIMTSVGLGVAIPSVLAYNAFLKNNRKIMSMINQFAEELHILVTTGTVLKVTNEKSIYHSQDIVK